MSKPIIKIENAKIHQGDNLVLSGVNLKVNAGEFLYLIGKTGSGKSSLLKTLYADLPLLEGEIDICGFPLKKIKRSKIPLLRRKLGIVFQDFQLLPDRSVSANLQFVLKATGWSGKEKMDKRVLEVLQQVGLDTKGYKMPHELSGGEQQRVAIARALLNNPEVILADEPTGNLDPETTAAILNLLHQISLEGTAVLIATHDYLYMEKFSTQAYQCVGGKLNPVAGN
ncbi:MAG: cell division ATP-binding protein FtsE [Luteibaculaceae bacterium]